MSDREKAIEALEELKQFIVEGEEGQYETIRAALEQTVPEGWKLVPVRPSPEMMEAWEGHFDQRSPSDGDRAEFVAQYSAMLAAAPTPEEQDDER